MLVVALGVTAELVVPRLLQAQRVEEYSALVGELRQTVSEQAHPHTTLHAATALTYVRHTEGLSVVQAVELLASPVAPEEVTTVADEDVTDELIEELRQSIATVNTEVKQTQHAIVTETERQEFVSQIMAAMLPVLQQTAAAIDDHLAAVEHAGAKAKEDIAERTSLAAMNVRDSAAGDDIAQIQGRIAAYVVAGEASLESHAAVVKAEEEEAEAKRKAEEEAAKRKSSAGSGGGSSCLKYVSTWYGGSRLVTVPCRYLRGGPG